MKPSLTISSSLPLSLALLCIHLSLNVHLVESDTSERSKFEEAVVEFMEKYNGNGTDFNLESWEAPEEMRRNLPYYLSGFDEDNRPIWIAEWGKWDAKKYIEAGGEDAKNYDLYADQLILRMLKSAHLRSTPEHPVNDWVFIIDMDGFPLEQLTSSGALLYNLRKFGSSAPLFNGIEKGFIVNTSFLAERIVNLISPLLGRSFDRFEVYGTNKAKWIPRLLKQVPRSQLPEWYGGAKDYKPLQVYG